MPIVTQQKFFGGFQLKADRLGLNFVFEEVRHLIASFQLNLKEEKHANGGAVIREMLDSRFASATGWSIKKSGGIDWTKEHHVNGTTLSIGVELQVSARSDLLTNDLMHLMQEMERGAIDLGIIVVPDDRTARFLPDRCPSWSAALDHVDRAKAIYHPIAVLAISHDGPGEALPKRRTNLGLQQDN